MAALVELRGAIPALEPAIHLCRQVSPLGHRCRTTTRAIHCNQPRPAAILGKPNTSATPSARGVRRDRTAHLRQSPPTPHVASRSIEAPAQRLAVDQTVRPFRV